MSKMMSDDFGDERNQRQGQQKDGTEQHPPAYRWASVISMEELLRRSQLLIQIRFKVLEIFVVAAIYYLILTTIWGFVQRYLEAHFGRAYVAQTSARKKGLVISESEADIEKTLLEQDAR